MQGLPTKSHWRLLCCCARTDLRGLCSSASARRWQFQRLTSQLGSTILWLLLPPLSHKVFVKLSDLWGDLMTMECKKAGHSQLLMQWCFRRTHTSHSCTYALAKLVEELTAAQVYLGWLVVGYGHTLHKMHRTAKFSYAPGFVSTGSGDHPGIQSFGSFLCVNVCVCCWC